MLLRNKNVKEYIGVFDSGAGGVTVLKECTKLLPEENFYYYGDSKHAPYGEKSVKEVQDRTLEAMNQMVNHGVKAIVIACNTATSAAVNIVRNVYPQIPVIGVEPALKPAASAHQKVLVMATRNTLSLDKFHELAKQYGNAEVIPCACDHLAQTIEEGHLNDEVLDHLLHQLLDQYVGKCDSVVLGCTHYPIVKEKIVSILGGVPCYDGGEGTARQLKRKLEEHDLFNTTDLKGDVIFESSSPEAEALYQKIYNAL
ncbi:glutamate racemase [Intestinibaculum porci]|uniref:glutamate racemase n=1 Tax=Intestinibaculum porci TaxID=2487118 RepID=UPI000EEB7151|nr:glutamate racemase [Intestinibaculum porci]MDD6350596.1 glutamate racemase [Intestinibaculum porci]MDD6422684.1 glutamate racemase [Intestinibaculum porci]HAN57733.1 glutamate racemase [Erysipelotrichaceae bacterium]